MYSWPVLLLGFCAAVLLLGLIPTLGGIAIYLSIQWVWNPILVGVAVLLFALYSIALYEIRNSIAGVLRGHLSLAVVFLSWIASRLIRLSTLLGTVFPVARIFDYTISKYPGRGFVQSFKDDFVARGLVYIENGVVEVEESSEELAYEARRHYDDAGRELASGEIVLGIGLAVLGVGPDSYLGIELPEMTISILSGVLVTVIALRFAAVDSLLFSNPTPKDTQERLFVIRDWNEGIGREKIGYWHMVMFKAVQSLSQPAYEFYLDWAFYSGVVNDGTNKIGAVRDLIKPCLVFIFAEFSGGTYRSLSIKHFGEDVFSEIRYPHLQFAEGGYAEKLRAELIQQQSQ